MEPSDQVDDTTSTSGGVAEAARTAVTVASAAKQVSAGAAAGGAVGAGAAAAKAVVQIAGSSPKARKMLILGSLGGLTVPVVGGLVMLLVFTMLGSLAMSGSQAAADQSLRSLVTTAEGFTPEEVSAVVSASQKHHLSWYVLASVMAEQKWRWSGVGPFRIVSGESGKVPSPGADDIGAATEWVAAKLEAAAVTAKVPTTLDIGSGATVFEDRRVQWSDEKHRDRQVVQPWVKALQKLPLDGVSESWAKTVFDQAVNWRLGLVTPEGCAAPTGIVADGAWVQPTIDADGKVGSGFGMRYHPVYHYWRLHAGADLGNKLGTPIWAAAAGTVVYVGHNSGAGHFLKIDHGSGVATQYLHMDSRANILVSVGDRVAVGQHIANMGNSGASTSAHLHFEVIINGTKVDPEKFYAEKGLNLAATPASAGQPSASAPTITITGTTKFRDANGKPVTFTKPMLENAKIISATISGLQPAKGTLTTSDRERLFVMAIMTGMAESTMGVNNGWDSGNVHVGIFQQNSQVGWYADGATIAENKQLLHDVALQTRNLVLGHDTIKGSHIPGLIDQKDWRTASMAKVVWNTQRPGSNDSIYARWQPVGEAVLKAFNGLLSSASMPGCQDSAQLTVVEANILFSLNSTAWASDLVRAGEGADILILNETSRGQATLKQYAKEHGFTVADHKSSVAANTTLFRSSLGKQVAGGTVKVCSAFENVSAKAILWATIDTGNGLLTIINTHAPATIDKGGKPIGSKQRRACAAAVFAGVAKVAAEKAKVGMVIGGGDLNVDYVNDRNVQYQKFPWTVVERRGVGDGMRSIYTASGVQGAGTLGARHIDYVYHWSSPSSPLQNVGYRIDTGNHSDHEFVTAWYSGTGATSGDEYDD